MNLQIIELYDNNDFPFGKLSNNYDDPLIIDNKTYPTITNYIYSNMLIQPILQQTLQNCKMTKKLPDNILTILKYINYLLSITTTLEEPIKLQPLKKFKQSFQRMTLLDRKFNSIMKLTGNTKQYYIKFIDNLFSQLIKDDIELAGITTKLPISELYSQLEKSSYVQLLTNGDSSLKKKYKKMSSSDLLAEITKNYKVVLKNKMYYKKLYDKLSMLVLTYVQSNVDVKLTNQKLSAILDVNKEFPELMEIDLKDDELNLDFEPSEQIKSTDQSSTQSHQKYQDVVDELKQLNHTKSDQLNKNEEHKYKVISIATGFTIDELTQKLKNKSLDYINTLYKQLDDVEEIKESNKKTYIAYLEEFFEKPFKSLNLIELKHKIEKQLHHDIHYIMMEAKQKELYTTIYESVLEYYKNVLTDSTILHTLLQTTNDSIIYHSTDEYLGINNQIGYNIVGKVLQQLRYEHKMKVQSSKLDNTSHYTDVYNVYTAYTMLMYEINVHKKDILDYKNLSINEIIQKYTDNKKTNNITILPRADVIKLYQSGNISDVILEELINPTSLVNNIRKLKIKELRSSLLHYKKEFIFSIYLENCIDTNFRSEIESEVTKLVSFQHSISEEQIREKVKKDAIDQLLKKLSLDEKNTLFTKVVDLYKKKLLEPELQTQIKEQIQQLNIPSRKSIVDAENYVEIPHFNYNNLCFNKVVLLKLLHSKKTKQLLNELQITRKQLLDTLNIKTNADLLMKLRLSNEKSPLLSSILDIINVPKQKPDKKIIKKHLHSLLFQYICKNKTEETPTTTLFEINDTPDNINTNKLNPYYIHNPLLSIEKLMYPTLYYYLYTKLLATTGFNRNKKGRPLVDAYQLLLKEHNVFTIENFKSFDECKSIYNNEVFSTENYMLQYLTDKALQLKFENVHLQELLLLTNTIEIHWNGSTEVFPSLSKNNKNIVGETLMKIRTQLQQSNKVKQVKVTNTFLLSDSLFLEWIQLRLTDACSIVSNVQDYFQSKYKYNFSIDQNYDKYEQLIPFILTDILKMTVSDNFFPNIPYNLFLPIIQQFNPLNKKKVNDKKLKIENIRTENTITHTSYSTEISKKFNDDQRQQFADFVKNLTTDSYIDNSSTKIKELQESLKKTMSKKDQTKIKNQIIKLQKYEPSSSNIIKIQNFKQKQLDEYNEFFQIKNSPLDIGVQLEKDKNIESMIKSINDKMKHMLKSYQNGVNHLSMLYVNKIISTFMDLLQNRKNITSFQLHQLIIYSNLLLSKKFTCVPLIHTYNCTLSAIINLLSSILQFKNNFKNLFPDLTIHTDIDSDDVKLAVCIILKTSFKNSVPMYDYENDFTIFETKVDSSIKGNTIDDTPFIIADMNDDDIDEEDKEDDFNIEEDKEDEEEDEDYGDESPDESPDESIDIIDEDNEDNVDDEDNFSFSMKPKTTEKISKDNRQKITNIVQSMNKINKNITSVVDEIIKSLYFISQFKMDQKIKINRINFFATLQI